MGGIGFEAEPGERTSLGGPRADAFRVPRDPRLGGRGEILIRDRVQQHTDNPGLRCRPEMRLGPTISPTINAADRATSFVCGAESSHGSSVSPAAFSKTPMKGEPSSRHQIACRANEARTARSVSPFMAARITAPRVPR